MCQIIPSQPYASYDFKQQNSLNLDKFSQNRHKLIINSWLPSEPWSCYPRTLSQGRLHQGAWSERRDPHISERRYGGRERQGVEFWGELRCKGCEIKSLWVCAMAVDNRRTMRGEIESGRDIVGKGSRNSPWIFWSLSRKNPIYVLAQELYQMEGLGSWLEFKD